MHEIDKVEKVLYQTGPGEPLIGFNIEYADGAKDHVGPILLEHELNAILKDAYDRGFEEGTKVATEAVNS